MRTMTWWTFPMGFVVLVGWARAQDAVPPLPAPIDFAKLDRAAPKLPAADGHRGYALFLFGLRGEHRVWAVSEAARAGAAPATLRLDLDADGELEADESFTGVTEKPRLAGEPAPVKFTIGDYRAPGGDAVHKEFTVTWTPKIGVRFRMLWRGEKVSFGSYGPAHDTYAGFADSAATAPVFVPGYDRPFEFERWIPDPLRPGAITDFKVFVGNRGDRVGAFAAVDDKFLPKGEVVLATLHYTTRAGKAATAHYELPERC
jgi:hypothetical protein